MRGPPYNKLSLQELIELNEEDEFDWKNVFVCISPNITLEFIEKYIDKPWDWTRVSVNPNLTPEFVAKHIDRDWDFKNGLSINRSVTAEFVEKFIDSDWDWSELAYNKTIPFEFYVKHNIKYAYVFSRRINVENVDKYMDKVKWNFGVGGLSNNPNLTLEFIEKYIDKRWDWGCYGLSNHPIITIDFVKKHKKKPWDRDSIATLFKQETFGIKKIYSAGYL